jgi:hypothetical protein
MPFQVALLRGGKLVIEQHHFCAAFGGSRSDFVGLAAAREKTRIRTAAAALDQAEDVQACRLRQALELLGGFGVIRSVKVEGDEQRAFAARVTFKQGEIPLNDRKAHSPSSSLPCQLIARAGTTVEIACL